VRRWRLGLPVEKLGDARYHAFNFSADRFHPNDLGHAYWFEMVKAGVEISGLVRDVRPGTSREAEEWAS